jgi:Leucine-rich repeat (LRR) protein
MRFFSSKKFFVILLLSTVLLSAALLLSACENAAGRFPAAPEITEGINETPAPVPPVEIDGVLFSAETPRLVLSGLKVDETVLEEVLPSFEVLDSLDLRGTSISHEYALSLSERYPETEIFWDVRLFGMLLPSDTKELDLTDTQLDSLNEVEDALKYYPYLEKVILPDIGFPYEDMDDLNRRYGDIRFVWTVHFSVYTLRTDATVFCASNIPKLGNTAPELTSQDLDPIKYCIDLEALDLGHMKYTDLEFLRDMTKMKYLILVQGKFSDISVIANMPDLYYLELFNNNRIIDLSPLISCKNLKHLNIGYCLFAEWETLKEMPWLERLWMPHVQISGQGLDELREALPDTLIYAPFNDVQGSTGGGWRTDQSYYDMRDLMEMPYYPGGTGMG